MLHSAQGDEEEQTSKLTPFRFKGQKMQVKTLIDTQYRHFNARALKEAAQGYRSHIDQGGKMFVTLAGAMSTAEIGLSLADMIRNDYVHGISCTGANIEEDLFNAIAHSSYHLLKSYRDLTPEDEQALLEKGMNRVTDTCIPEDTAMRKVDRYISDAWKKASDKGERKLPHEFFYEIVLQPEFQAEFEIDKRHSWVLAAAEKNLHIVVPGWEDSTLGNFFVSKSIMGQLNIDTVLSGLHYMRSMVQWYKQTSAQSPIGFFQIGGGIAGDFPICVVPLIEQDLEEDAALWAYFCQITDAQESYGGYSGALPNEKITWGKLAVDTPKFVIHSDASIIAPLIFNYMLEA